VNMMLRWDDGTGQTVWKNEPIKGDCFPVASN